MSTENMIKVKAQQNSSFNKKSFPLYLVGTEPNKGHHGNQAPSFTGWKMHWFLNASPIIIIGAEPDESWGPKLPSGLIFHISPNFIIVIIVNLAYLST